ncbi:radical SAM protein [Congregibacter litoralis]|nr:radical SAM protein [Congregibacter litoralis]
MKSIRLSLIEKALLKRYQRKLQSLSRSVRSTDGKAAVEKLQIIGQTVESFLGGELRPRAVAPVREINLISVCNARCIHCPGLFSQEIVRGFRMPDGKFRSRMPQDELELALTESDSVLDFFMNGSEFLLYPQWKQVASYLRSIGSELRISTNGILLTPSNSHHLIENRLLSKLNISLDGGTPATVERVRQGVCFERLASNVRGYFERASSERFNIPVGFSFVLMESNVDDLPDVVDLVASFRKQGPDIPVQISVFPLSSNGVAAYRPFLEREHHSRIPHHTLVSSFRRMLDRAVLHNIPLIAFRAPLERFVKAGCKAPPLNVACLPRVLSAKTVAPILAP